MLCATTVATYTCSNSTGTSCNKRAVVIPVFTNDSVCTNNQLIVVTHSEWKAVTAVTAPEYDYALGSAFWAFGFTGVMILYFSSHAIGLVLNAVRRF